MTLRSRQFWLLAGLVLLGYGVTHLYRLTSLPVFADEAIYIRWAQLIIDDWRQYAFFPLNDGKTPLHMWLMVPFQFVFSDQLWAGRFVSVLAGLFQVGVMGYLTLQLGGRPKTALLTMALTTLLPFWFFHHRLALIDGLLTLWLSFTLVFILQIAQSKRVPVLPVILAGVLFGLALWTKLPAILAAPALLLFACWPKFDTVQACVRKGFYLGVALALGVGLFGLMKLHPAFGQLFNRGSDFLYPWQDVVLHGAWRQTLINIPTYIHYFGSYLTWPLLALIVAGLFAPRHQRTIHLLFWAGILFIAPIALLGRVVYPRYLFPACLFFTLAAGLSLQAYLDVSVNQVKHFAYRAVASLILILLLANTVATSTLFATQLALDPDRTALVSADKTQYLHEWSSGHGIQETVEMIALAAETQKIAVGTEGYFGTLPDGLLMYFHRRNVENVYIEGIGYPVDEIPAAFADRAQEFDQIWIVVNSHRMKIELPENKLLAEFCRPDDAPCLQVWDATELIKRSN